MQHETVSFSVFFLSCRLRVEYRLLLAAFLVSWKAFFFILCYFTSYKMISTSYFQEIAESYLKIL